MKYFMIVLLAVMLIAGCKKDTSPIIAEQVYSQVDSLRSLDGDFNADVQTKLEAVRRSNANTVRFVHFVIQQSLQDSLFAALANYQYSVNAYDMAVEDRNNHRERVIVLLDSIVHELD